MVMKLQKCEKYENYAAIKKYTICNKYLNCHIIVIKGFFQVRVFRYDVLCLQNMTSVV